MTTETQATIPCKESLLSVLDRPERNGAKREQLHDTVDAMQSCHNDDSVRTARGSFGKREADKVTLVEFSDALEAMTQRLWGIKALLHGFDEDLDGDPLFGGAHQLVADAAHEMERIAEAFASEISAQPEYSRTPIDRTAEARRKNMAIFGNRLHPSDGPR